MSGKEDHLPSTEQIASSLDKVGSSQHLQEVVPSLSPTGQKVIHDVEKIADTTAQIIRTKNEDDHLQKAIKHSQKATSLTDYNQFKTINVGGSAKELKESAADLAHEMVHLAKLTTTSAPFREILGDFLNVVREIVGERVTETERTERTERTEKITRKLAAEKDKILNQDCSKREVVHSIVDVMADTVEDTTERLGKVEISTERMERMIERVKGSVRAIQESAEFQDAIEGILNIFSSIIEKVSYLVEEVKHKGKEAIQDTEADVEARKALEHVQILLENFANYKSLDSCKEKVAALARAVANDNELNELYVEWKEFIIRSIRDVDFIDNEEYTNYASDLYQHLSDVIGGKYKAEFYDVIDSISDFVKGFSEDPQNAELASDISELVKDLFYEDGSFVLKPELFKDFGKLVPLIANKLAIVPLPRIVQEDKKYKCVFDNVIINCSNILPKYVNVAAQGEYSSGEADISFGVMVSEIELSGRDIMYYIKKKRGCCPVTDRGLVEFKIGLTAEVFVFPCKDGIEVECNVNIDKLQIRLYKSNHNIIHKVFKRTIEKIAKKQIKRAIEDNLTDVITKMMPKSSH